MDFPETRNLTACILPINTVVFWQKALLLADLVQKLVCTRFSSSVV